MCLCVCVCVCPVPVRSLDRTNISTDRGRCNMYRTNMIRAGLQRVPPSYHINLQMSVCLSVCLCVFPVPVRSLDRTTISTDRPL